MTASHNPAAYNGMKCYDNDDSQQSDEPAAKVYARMQKIPVISEPTVSIDELIDQGKVFLIYDEVIGAYYYEVLAQGICTEQIVDSGLKILYTPLHETGLKPCTTLFDRIGVDYDALTVQAIPDGNFPTCPYPNPEIEEAWNEALKAANTPAPAYDLASGRAGC